MPSELIEAVNQSSTYVDDYKCCHIPYAFYTPSFFVVLAATLNDRAVDFQSFSVDASNSGYFSAIGLSKALWGVDDYTNNRTNLGSNYSLVTRLDSAEQTDTCNTQIAGCLRNMVGDHTSSGFGALLHVVGELHDNVWSHGKKTGFSHAQKWKVPYSDGGDHYLEFSLADKGLGFLQEIRRSGKTNVSSHREAIEWCIQEGHSTKHGDDIDEWAQSVPSDILGGSPFCSGVETRINDGNHHQGLGLHHLVSLVKTYNGELTIVSGDAAFSVDEQGNESFSLIQSSWQGVAISCRVRESRLMSVEQRASDSVLNIMDRLTKGGGFS